MRVGIVTPWYPPTVRGGGEISVQLLAERLAERDDVDEVSVFSFDGRATADRNGVSVVRLGSPPLSVMELGNAFALAKFRINDVDLASFDVLHGYNMLLHPVVGQLSHRLNVSSVATLNSYDVLPKSAFGVEADGLRRLYELTALPTTGRLLRRWMKHMDAFVTLSDASKAVYQANGFAGNRFEVVPNMYDPSFTVPDLAGDPEVYEVLYVGSLIKEKGVRYLVAAMSNLPEDVHLRIVGDGDRRDYLERLASEQGVTSRVEFTGKVPYEAVKRFYATADLFVHPGVWPEPFGRTILEAMQAGLPVVATNVGGPSEIVPDRELLCPTRDPPALAATIERARKRGDGVGEYNRQYVAEHFSPETVVQAIRSLYADLQ